MTGLTSVSDRAAKCAECSTGYVLTETSTCGLCLLSNCETCETTTACKTCLAGFFVEDVKDVGKICSPCHKKM